MDERPSLVQQATHPHSRRRTHSEPPHSFMPVKPGWVPPIHTVAMTLTDAATGPPPGRPSGAAGCIAPGTWGRQPAQRVLRASIPPMPGSKEARYNQLFFHYRHVKSRNTRTSLEKFLFEQPDMTLTDKPIYTRETVEGGI